MEKDVNFRLIMYYLDKNYEIIHYSLINKNTGLDEWGYEVIEDITFLFSLDYNFVEEVVEAWVLSNGLTYEEWENAFIGKQLRTIFNPRRRLELQRIIGMSAERQVTRDLAKAIGDEIDSEILKELRKQLQTSDELTELLKCLGYEFGKTWYDPLTQAPNYPIVTTTEYRKLHEQKNNTYWKDWFRARRQNEET